MAASRQSGHLNHTVVSAKSVYLDKHTTFRV